MQSYSVQSLFERENVGNAKVKSWCAGSHANRQLNHQVESVHCTVDNVDHSSM